MNLSNIAVIAAIAGTTCSILFGWVGYKRGLLKDCSDSSKNKGTLMSDIGYIKSGIDDLKKKQDITDERYLGLIERVKGTEDSVKSAHHRIDSLERKGVI